MEIKIKNLEESKEFGIKLGKILQAEDIVCLNGDLGMGKTTLTKAIGLGLGVEEYITSPSFTLINEYRGRIKLYHFDLYRLDNLEEVYDLGFDEYLFGPGVSVIEWAEKIEKSLPKERINIDIGPGQGAEERIFTLSGYGESYKQLVKELNKE